VLLGCWNSVFACSSDRWPLRIKRKLVARDIMRDNMRCQPKGRGNAAWRKVGAMIQAQRDNPALLMWPDYLFPARKGAL
jgi:hypothetical protein